MVKKKHSIHLDDDIYISLRAEQLNKVDKVPLRQLLRRYVSEGIERDRELSNFKKALDNHFQNSENAESFKQYLNSRFIDNLIQFLDDTRPSYKDIAAMNAAILFWNLKARDFFSVIMTYAKYGLSDLKGD
jgi:hypothetical protein